MHRDRERKKSENEKIEEEKEWHSEDESTKSERSMPEPALPADKQMSAPRLLPAKKVHEEKLYSHDSSTPFRKKNPGFPTGLHRDAGQSEKLKKDTKAVKRKLLDPHEDRPCN